MTAAECADWLALDRHQRRLDAMGSKATTEDYYRDPEPFPLTLDGAARAMPDRWWWTKECEDGEPVYWYAFDKLARLSYIRIPDTGDEITDRYKLAVACCKAEKDDGR